MKQLTLLLILALFIQSSVNARNYPHILIKETDKNTILSKIEQYQWAKSIFEKTKEDVRFYVDQHQKDPEWILDRYLMNRVPGKRYTRFVSDSNGTQLIRYEGDAPVPTIRVSPHKRSPVTVEGEFYVLPAIKELTAKDTSLTMRLKNPSTNQYEQVDPQNYVGRINSGINKLAFESAVLFWLTGEEKYARFSADILNQWAAGAVYQEPISGPGRVGFLDIQTLGDEGSKFLILAYDFIQPFMRTNGYRLDYYDIVFEKIASTLAFRGYTGNNWYAAESSTMVAAALSLSDSKKQTYYLDYFLTRDTINDGCGQLAMPSTVKIWFTPDGHWKEPGGYHNYPVSKLIESAVMIENNGIEVFKSYPQLLEASFVMLKYSFPNLTASAFGDTGRPSQSPYCLEIALRKAQEYHLPVLDKLASSMKELLDKGNYDRSEGGIEGLLCYLPELPLPESAESIAWDRTGKLDFASFFHQRNGMDRETGLMCAVQGATYNHNHSNGMAMELYGKGAVMGIDPGNGPTYEHPMHVNYYTQWAAHNTVIAAGASTSIRPFTGGGGTKEIGEVKLVSMEPLAGEEAISGNYSFTLTTYHEGSTNTNQQRLLSLVRINDKEGYYLDIYRSDNPVSNDYIYHNIGENLDFYSFDGTPVITSPTDTYPRTKEDKPGLRFFKQTETTGVLNESIIAMFTVSQCPSGKAFMKLWIPGTTGRSYYKAVAPASKTAAAPYNKPGTPVIGIRLEEPAVDKPFVVIYEPTKGGLQSTIRNVRQYSDPNNSPGIILEVETINNQKQVIFTSLRDKPVSKDQYSFSGDFGLISTEAQKTIYYLGSGTKLGDSDMTVQTVHGINGNICLIKHPDKLEINAKAPCRIIIKDKALYNKLNKEALAGHITEQSGHGILNLDKGNYIFRTNK